MRPVFVFTLKFAVFRAKFRKNEGEKEKKEKEKKTLLVKSFEVFEVVHFDVVMAESVEGD